MLPFYAAFLFLHSFLHILFFVVTIFAMFMRLVFFCAYSMRLMLLI